MSGAVCAAELQDKQSIIVTAEALWMKPKPNFPVFLALNYLFV